ncbi:MAG TPA: cyclic nucleotide-binding domain-containing protein [Tepidisphaeraceae bacterium]|nr:cyclic nucleotide-binding domain-containing protein [Tepidisphaeraceae bacterium]
MIATEIEFMTRPQRWDVAFGPEMSEQDVDRLLAVEPFRSVDATRFPAKLSLRDILKNDTRIVRFKEGDIVLREGDYGDSAFLVLSGAVRVALDALNPRLLGRREPKKRSLLRAIAQHWTNPRNIEVRDLHAYEIARQGVGSRGEGAHDTHIFLQDVDRIISSAATARLETGEVFGELAALGRTPRTASIFAEGDTELLEIRWQGLREIRSRSEAIKNFIDSRYRERALSNQLKHTALFAGLSDADLSELADATEFETYGTFDWNTSYASLARQDPAARLLQEPVIAQEGDYPNGLIIVRSGFARVSVKHGNGSKTTSYLGKGQVYGLDELTHNFGVSDPSKCLPLQHTLRAIGYVNILRVPTALIEKHVLRKMARADERDRPVPPKTPSGGKAANGAELIDAGTLEFLADGRFINGTRTMMIDMDRCTRCDDCVRACASTHDNNPRFIRHGPIHGHHMIANACMHCQDPVCMIGCPTGAISRDPATGNVVINDNTCIGCATCANSCPYENIRMVEIRTDRGLPILDQNTSAPIFKATKCDLCVDQWGGPACERACPHDALKRVDMSDLASLGSWLRR